MQTICHLTSVHPPFDIRIFHKQCVSLVQAGYAVKLIAPIENATSKNGVELLPIKLPKSRLKRMFIVNWRMLKVALKTNARLFHFHDPELLLCGVFLKLSGKKVVFDIHENVRLSFVSKSWLPKVLVPFATFFYFTLERLSMVFFDALVLAEESYQKYYPKNKSTIVLNYPIINGDINTDMPDKDESCISLVYVGGISENRGVWEMIQLTKVLIDKKLNCRLKLVGTIYSDVLKEQIKAFVKNEHLDNVIEIVGRIPFEQVSDMLKYSHVGLAILKPIPNYRESLPTKIFEYMQYGLPVITNNFPLYKRYIEDENTGICIDFDNFEKEITPIINLISDPQRCKELGNNGRACVQKFNWTNEAKKLIELYKNVLN